MKALVLNVSRAAGLAIGALASLAATAGAQPASSATTVNIERITTDAPAPASIPPVEPSREVAAWDGESALDVPPPRTDSSVRAAFADYSFISSQRPLAEPSSWARVNSRFINLLDRKAYTNAHERLVFTVYAAYCARIAGQLSTRDARTLQDHALAAVRDLNRLTYPHEIDIIVEAIVLGGLKPDVTLVRLVSDRVRPLCN